MLHAGMRLVQIRHKAEWTQTLYEEARVVARLCAESGATLIINDRADVAKLLGVGVHVGQTDLRPSDVRKIVGDGVVVGL